MRLRRRADPFGFRGIRSCCYISKRLLVRIHIHMRAYIGDVNARRGIFILMVCSQYYISESGTRVLANRTKFFEILSPQRVMRIYNIYYIIYLYYRVMLYRRIRVCVCVCVCRYTILQVYIVGEIPMLG